MAFRRSCGLDPSLGAPSARFPGGGGNSADSHRHPGSSRHESGRRGERLRSRPPAGFADGMEGSRRQAARLRRRWARACRCSSPIRWTWKAVTDRATLRANPSAPYNRTRSLPRGSRLWIAASTAGCGRRIFRNVRSAFRSRSTCPSFPFFGSTVVLQQRVQGDPVGRGWKAPIETAQEEIGEASLGFPDHGHGAGSTSPPSHRIRGCRR